MPSVSQVRPKIWTNVLDLYDDGEYSAIWGTREDALQRELGVRWNGSEEYVGYPNQGANPLWFSQPRYLEKPILLELLGRLASSETIERRVEFINNIVLALKESN